MHLLDYWKPIPKFEGLYEASYAGFVRSITRKHSFIDKNGVEYNKWKYSCTLHYTYNKKKGKTTYKVFTLYKDSIQIKILRSRIMASSFIPNTNNLPEVNHIDGIKINDNPSNLEWCTSKYNTAHAIKTGLRKIGGRQFEKGRIPECAKMVLCLRTGVFFDSARALEQSRNITRNTLTAYLRGLYPNNKDAIYI